MRFALSLLNRRRLLMSFDATKRTSPSPSSRDGYPSRLKRSFSQQATTTDPNPATEGGSHQESSTPFAKVPKLDGVQSPSAILDSSANMAEGSSIIPPPIETTSSAPRAPRNFGMRSSRLTSSSAPPFRLPSKRRGRGSSGSIAPGASSKTIDLPVRDESYLLSEHQKKAGVLPPIKKIYTENPKSPLSNFCTVALGKPPEYQASAGHYPTGGPRGPIWRCVLFIFLSSII